MQCLCNHDEDIYEIKIDENAAQGPFSLFANVLFVVFVFM